MVQNRTVAWWLLVPAAALLLFTTAWLRGAEYDEQYTLFLTAGTPRPAWPETVFPAGRVAQAQMGGADVVRIARDLRSTDVHPPLYFITVAFWRHIFGPGLLTVRLLSVLCGTLSVLLTGLIARARGMRPGAPMLVLLGCYGFVYTSAIARGFAMAEVLALGGTLLVLRRRAWLGGLLLGTACACNYLAVFVAAAAVLTQGAWAAGMAMLPFLALDGWFFLAQHGSRDGQFPAFSLLPSLVRLAGYQVGAVFGGLPLYAQGLGRMLVGAVVGVAGLAAVWCARGSFRDWRALALVAATPAGLLLLGLVFDTTPIELRYLTFGLPFLALLLGRRGLSPALGLVVAVQAAGVAGLMLAPQTMQPARATARSAAALVGDGIVLVPRGNDGVGIVGAFGIEAPPALPLLLVRAGDPVAAEVSQCRRVVVAMLAQDAESRSAVATMKRVFEGPGWRRVGIGANVAAYERTDPGG